MIEIEPDIDAMNARQVDVIAALLTKHGLDPALVQRDSLSITYGARLCLVRATVAVAVPTTEIMSLLDEFAADEPELPL